MTMTETKLKQWGNSLALIVPKDIVRLEELSAGETVKVEIIKNKRIDAFGIFKGGSSFSKEDKGDSDF